MMKKTIPHHLQDRAVRNAKKGGLAPEAVPQGIRDTRKFKNARKHLVSIIPDEDGLPQDFTYDELAYALMNALNGMKRKGMK